MLAERLRHVDARHAVEPRQVRASCADDRFVAAGLRFALGDERPCAARGVPGALARHTREHRPTVYSKPTPDPHAVSSGVPRPPSSRRPWWRGLPGCVSARSTDRGIPAPRRSSRAQLPAAALPGDPGMVGRGIGMVWRPPPEGQPERGSERRGEPTCLRRWQKSPSVAGRPVGRTCALSESRPPRLSEVRDRGAKHRPGSTAATLPLFAFADPEPGHLRAPTSRVPSGSRCSIGGWPMGPERRSDPGQRSRTPPGVLIHPVRFSRCNDGAPAVSSPPCIRNERANALAHGQHLWPAWTDAVLEQEPCHTHPATSTSSDQGTSTTASSSLQSRFSAT